MDKTSFRKVLGAEFDGSGFVRKGQSWFLRGEDATVVVQMQKSDFADKFYLNVGIWLNALGECEFPRENHCHIQTRVEGLFPACVSLVDKACNLELADPSDVDELARVLRDRLVPFCNSALDLDGLRHFAAQQFFSRALVFKEARALLELC